MPEADVSTPEGKTGPLVAALADAVHDDLGEIADTLRAARTLIERLRDVSGQINGLSGDCAGWSRHIETLLEEIDKEARETPAKLRGEPIAKITQQVDAEHEKRVLAAKNAQ